MYFPQCIVQCTTGHGLVSFWYRHCVLSRSAFITTEGDFKCNVSLYIGTEEDFKAWKDGLTKQVFPVLWGELSWDQLDAGGVSRGVKATGRCDCGKQVGGKEGAYECHGEKDSGRDGAIGGAEGNDEEASGII